MQKESQNIKCDYTVTHQYFSANF